MFAQTQDLEFGQGQSRDVPDRELALNINTLVVVSVWDKLKDRVCVKCKCFISFILVKLSPMLSNKLSL